MNIEVTSKHYTLTEEYVNDKGELATASVKLIINDAQKKFEVLPGDHMDSFNYTSRGKADFAKWVAVSKLVYMAVEFGVKDLKLELTKPEDLPQTPAPGHE